MSELNGINSNKTALFGASSKLLTHHKMGPGAAALNAPVFQEMDEYAPYRIAFLFLIVLSSIALWASYKIFCKREISDDGLVYHPLSTAARDISSLRRTDAEWGDEESLSSEDSAFLVTSSTSNTKNQK